MRNANSSHFESLHDDDKVGIIFNKHFREDHVDTIAKAVGVPVPAEVLLLHHLHCVWDAFKHLGQFGNAIAGDPALPTKILVVGRDELGEID